MSDTLSPTPTVPLDTPNTLAPVTLVGPAPTLIAAPVTLVGPAPTLIATVPDGTLSPTAPVPTKIFTGIFSIPTKVPVPTKITLPHTIFTFPTSVTAPPTSPTGTVTSPTTPTTTPTTTAPTTPTAPTAPTTPVTVTNTVTVTITTPVTITVPVGQPTIQVVNNNTNQNTNIVDNTVLQQQLSNLNSQVQVLLEDQQNVKLGPTVVGSPVSTVPLGTPNPIQPTDNFQVIDQTGGFAFNTPGAPYDGPVGGIDNEFINLNADNLSITALTPNVFIHSGSGNDALQALSGSNLLNAGGGSNVMIGGIGEDAFIADSDPNATVADLIQNFHQGDVLTVTGLTADDFSYALNNVNSAFGPALQITATPLSNPKDVATAITISGRSVSDVNNGNLTLNFSSTPNGQPYLLVTANT